MYRGKQEMEREMAEMILDILEPIIERITGENRKTIKSLAPTETYASILDKCAEGEKEVVTAFHDKMEAMLVQGPESGSTEYRILCREIDKEGEILYSRYGWSNENVQELQVIVTYEWLTENFSKKKSFERIMADYLIRARYPYPADL
jgi:hypothetical protein